MITSIRDYIDSINEGKFWRCDFQKQSGAVVYTAGRWYDMSMVSGTPRQNVYPGGLLTATKLYYKSGGAMWTGMAVSPEEKYITKALIYHNVTTLAPSTLLFCDYIMFYPLIDMDEVLQQDLDNVISLPRYTTGEGVKAFLVITSDTGAGAHNFTMTYTNSQGVAGRVSPSVACTPGAIIGHIAMTGTAAGNLGPFIPLQDGDTGIRSVQSVQLDAGSGAGWACLVLCRPLLDISSSVAGVPCERNLLTDKPSLPKVEDEAFLCYIMYAGGAVAASSVMAGALDFIWS